MTVRKLQIHVSTSGKQRIRQARVSSSNSLEARKHYDSVPLTPPSLPYRRSRTVLDRLNVSRRILLPVNPRGTGNVPLLNVENRSNGKLHRGHGLKFGVDCPNRPCPYPGESEISGNWPGTLYLRCKVVPGRHEKPQPIAFGPQELKMDL